MQFSRFFSEFFRENIQKDETPPSFVAISQQSPGSHSSIFQLFLGFFRVQQKISFQLQFCNEIYFCNKRQIFRSSSFFRLRT